jgi:DNA-binding NarL/FixJ family response regulator
MKRRAAVAIERVAYNGSPDDIALNRKLVREFSRKAPQGNESSSVCVKKSTSPAPPRLGRRKPVPRGAEKLESWESEMLRLAGTGLGVHKIARALQAQHGVAISGPTVSIRLRELQGQLRLIS